MVAEQWRTHRIRPTELAGSPLRDWELFVDGWAVAAASVAVERLPQGLNHHNAVNSSPTPFRAQEIHPDLGDPSAAGYRLRRVIPISHASEHG